MRRCQPLAFQLPLSSSSPDRIASRNRSDLEIGTAERLQISVNTAEWLAASG